MGITDFTKNERTLLNYLNKYDSIVVTLDNVPVVAETLEMKTTEVAQAKNRLALLGYVRQGQTETGATEITITPKGRELFCERPQSNGSSILKYFNPRNWFGK